MGKMLVVSAHGADWCTRAGDMILKYVELGWEVTVFALTYGEHGESGNYWKDHPGCSLEEVKSCREQEARAAAGKMGVKEIRFFDYGDYPLCMDESRVRRLTADILAIRPDVILTHWRIDKINPDHEICARAVFQAVTAAGMRGALPDTEPHFIPDIFLFETTIPHPEFNQFEIDTFVDISDVMDRKMEAVKLFKAQPQLVGYYEKCATDRGFQANDWSRGRRPIRYAEGLKRYTPYLGDQLPISRLAEEGPKGTGTKEKGTKEKSLKEKSPKERRQEDV